MTYSRVMDLAVGKMDDSIAEWCRRHPDYVYDKPHIIHEKVEDGVHYGQVWLAEDFFIFVFGESWDEVDLKGKLRWAKITGKPVGV